MQINLIVSFQNYTIMHFDWDVTTTELIRSDHHRHCSLY